MGQHDDEKQVGISFFEMYTSRNPILWDVETWVLIMEGDIKSRKPMGMDIF
jgi:hypothetical protein